MAKVTAEDIPELLQRLACEDAEARNATLRQLCPCRSRCYDQDIWVAICRVYNNDMSSREIQNSAFHVLETLVQSARTPGLYRELLDWLLENRHLTLPLENPEVKPRRAPTKEPKPHQRVTSKDVPRLLELLSCGDPDAQQRTLQTLCPCRNVRYDKEVWLAIFHAYEDGENGHVRDQAGHAIDTLLTRARTDPRSQRLLHWLAEQGIASLPLEHNVPVWDPLGRAGLNGVYIPRYERAPRSKANRRR